MTTEAAPNLRAKDFGVPALPLIQIVLTSCAVILSVWIRLPALCSAAFGLLGASALAARVWPGSQPEQAWRLGAVSVWVWTLVVPATIVIGGDNRFRYASCWDYFYAVLAWLMAATVLLTSQRIANPAGKSRWRKPAMSWALVGLVLWLLTAYWKDDLGAFLLGLVLGVILLMLCKRWFQMRALGIQVANTLILLLAGLPLTELAIHPRGALAINPAALEKYCNYKEARKDRAAFSRWWNYFWEQWSGVEKAIIIKDPNAPEPYRLRPNSHGVLVRSAISINSLGFRGKEIPREKGNAYRIVALGESSTFCLTIGEKERPWPELLEEMIRNRLKPERPVEVINAGVPAATLPENLHHLTTGILPLKPDMVISYHGINGFHFLDKGIPPTRGKAPPTYRPRPLQLLGDVEYRLRLNSYNRSQKAGLYLQIPTFSNILESQYAGAYRQLITIARTNNFQLVLGTFSMAVNGQSEPEAVEFYRAMFALVYRQIKANAAHTLLLRQLAEQNPDVCLVDTQPHLDGDTDKFLDLMHLREAGERQLAEAFFAGITNILRRDLSPAYNEARGF